MSQFRIWHLQFISLLWLSCLMDPAVSAQVSPDSAPKKYALLIGVTAYQVPGMNNPALRFPEADAKALAEALEQSGYKVDLLLGERAGRQAIRDKLAELKQYGNEGGVVLIGLFGRGVNSEGDPGDFFCPYDTTTRDALDPDGKPLVDGNGQPLIEPNPESLIPLTELLAALQTSAAGNRVLLADCCCRSPHQLRDKAFGSSLDLKAVPEKTACLFARSANEQTVEHQEWGHGAFTKCLLEEMQDLFFTGETGTAPLAAALKITVPELIASVAPTESQIPVLLARDSVDLQLRFDEDYVRSFALIWGLGTKIDERRGFEHLLKAARRDHPLAMCSVATFYHLGLHVPQDKAEASRLVKQSLPRLKKLAAKGHRQAQAVLGGLYDKGIGVEPNLRLTIRWYRRAAEQNHPLAQTNLGVHYGTGAGVSKDPVAAVQWYQKAAAQHLALAQNNLGVMYFQGSGVAKDPAMGFKLYRQAADQNLSLAQHNLGVKYWQGEGVAKDFVEARRLFLLAADQEHADAQFHLGMMYAAGDGVNPDPVEAAKWYRKAAEQNNQFAQYALGVAYTRGEGVTKDPAESAKWLRKAAEQNDASAQFDLGIMYINGSGVDKDPVEAVRWARKAALQNDPGAQLFLGEMYARGIGVTKDADLALKWARKAMANPNITELVKQNGPKLLQLLGEEP